MDHKKVAQQVIDAVGRDNMVGAAHCATRLRLVLKDDSKIDQAALDANPDVKGTFKTNGQYQIIIGPGDVNNVYAELIKETGLKEASTEELKKLLSKAKSSIQSWLSSNFCLIFSFRSFLPWLPVVC